MNSDIQTNISGQREGRASRRKRGRTAFIIFFILWLGLIGVGVYAAKSYTEHTRDQLIRDIELQTAAQIEQMQQQYEQRIEEIEQAFAAEMIAVGSRVEALNELLTFTKDNATDETDNSNMLYTQINEVKQKLDALQKRLDVLQ